MTGSAFGTHDRHWIESHLRRDAQAQILDMTSARAVINICGPKARDVLQAVTEEDISNAAFPFSTNRQITVGAAPVLAIRIGYVGELGWGAAHSRPNTPRMSTSVLREAAKRKASATPATAPSIPAGWRRAISTGRATSRRITSP